MRAGILIDQVGQIVNGDHHFAAVEQGHIAMGNVQDVWLFTAKFAIGELQLFLVPVNAADERDVLWNFRIFCKFLGVAQSDFVADVLQPMLNAGANAGTADHACVNCDFRHFFHCQTSTSKFLGWECRASSLRLQCGCYPHIGRACRQGASFRDPVLR